MDTRSRMTRTQAWSLLIMFAVNGVIGRFYEHTSNEWWYAAMLVLSGVFGLVLSMSGGKL